MRFSEDARRTDDAEHVSDSIWSNDWPDGAPKLEHELKSPLNEPGLRYLDGDYLSANPDWHADDAPWKVGHIRQILARSGIVPDSFCEVGCGSGYCTQLVHEMFPNALAEGFEISPQAFAICSGRQVPGLSYHNGSPFGQVKAYDLALALDVIEHVEDPFAFIRQMAAISRYQLFHIPLDMNALSVAREWPVLDARAQVGHIHYFSRGTAVALLRECGLEIIDEHYTPWAIDQSDKTWKKRLAAVPRRLAFSLSSHNTVRLLGGWSLMVLTRPAPQEIGHE